MGRQCLLSGRFCSAWAGFFDLTSHWAGFSQGKRNRPPVRALGFAPKAVLIRSAVQRNFT